MTPRWKYSLRMGTAGALVSVTAYVFNISMFGLMWMAVACFMVMDVRTAGSLKLGLNRSLGSLAGALLGIILASIFNFQSLFIVMLAFLIIGATSAFIYSREKSVRLMAMTAAIVYLLIVASPDNQDFAWRIGLSRAFDNILAITVTMLVSIFVLPVSTLDELRKQQQQLLMMFNKICGNFQQAIQNDLLIDNAALIKQARQSNALIKTLWEESATETQLDPAKQTTTMQQRLYLSQLNYFLCHLAERTSNLQNPIIQLLKTELVQVFSQLASFFQQSSNAKQLFSDVDLRLVNEKVALLLQRFEQIRQQKILPNFSTAEVEDFYQLLIGLQLMQTVLQEKK